MSGIFSRKFWQKQVFDDVLGFNPPKNQQPPHNQVNTNTDNAAAEEAARREQQARRQQEELAKKQQEHFQAGQKTHVDYLFEAKINEENLQENQDQSISGRIGDFSTEASL